MDILGLYNAGYGMEEIADALGITLRTVDDKLRELGLEPDYPVSESLWDKYRKKISVVRHILGYESEITFDPTRSKKDDKEYELFFTVEWLKATALLTR